MAHKEIIFNVEDGIGSITLNEPEKLNPLSEERMEEFDRALTESEKTIMLGS